MTEKVWRIFGDDTIAVFRSDVSNIIFFFLFWCDAKKQNKNKNKNK